MTIGLIKITGEAAKKFLQGQLTCHLDEVTSSGQLGAHCNPQGRVIHLFWIFLLNNEYYLQMPAEMVSIALAALKKYAVFFKVEMSDASSDFPLVQHYLKKFPDIAAGIPAIYPETSEKFLPHEINLPALNGISFNKGCYTGQEIIARMQYRGKLKTKLIHEKITSSKAPERGADIFSNHELFGTIVDYQALDQNTYELLIIAPENQPPIALSLER